MKNLTFIFLLMFVPMMTLAQEQASNASLNERFYKAKLREMVYRLNITSDQMKRFEPIYRSYCEEMTDLWAERKKPLSPNTSSKAAAIEKRRIEMQQRAQGIRMKYIDKFATVLNARQVERFYDEESAIQKKLKERKEQARGQ